MPQDGAMFQRTESMEVLGNKTLCHLFKQT